MFNLLKSDLYRTVRWATFWVYVAIMVAMVAAAATLLNWTASPEFAALVQENAYEQQQSALTEAERLEIQADMAEDLADNAALNSKVLPSLSHTWAQLLCSGLLGILGSTLAVALLYGDFAGGFIKNLLMSRRGRFVYFGEKLLFVALLQAILLAVGAVAGTACFAAFGFSYETADGPAALALWLVETWLISTAAAFIVACITWITRSGWGGALAAAFISSGLMGVMISQLGSIFSVVWPWLEKLPLFLLGGNLRLLQGGAEALTAANDALPLFGSQPWAWVMLVAGIYLMLCVALVLGVLRRRDI